MYFLGIDGGGTKTKFTIVDENLNVMGSIIKGTTHYNQIGFENVGKVLREGIYEVCEHCNIDLKNINYIFIGIAGYGKIREIVLNIEESIKNQLKGLSYTIGNDVEIALAGSLNGECGINIIAGTGSIALALDKEGKLHRCGGWGYRLGDEGSAYYIGMSTLRCFTMQSDKRLDKTLIYDYIKRELNITNDYDIIKYINEDINGDRTQIANISKLCYEAAINGDKVAIEIFNKSAYELSRNIKALEGHFEKGEIIKVSYSGGVFKSGSFILDPLREFLDKQRFEIVKPISSPDIGACILAKMRYEK